MSLFKNAKAYRIEDYKLSLKNSEIYNTIELILYNFLSKNHKYYIKDQKAHTTRNQLHRAKLCLISLAYAVLQSALLQSSSGWMWYYQLEILGWPCAPVKKTFLSIIIDNSEKSNS